MLVQRNKKHARVVIKDGLCAVTVVHLPVNDGDAPNATLHLCYAGG